MKLHPLTLKQRPVMVALVVSVPTGPGEQYAMIVHGTTALLEDIDEGLASREAFESLGDPPGPGIWIWVGTIRVHKSFDGDVDVDYVGTYRPATSDEVTRLRTGIPLEGEGWQAGTSDAGSDSDYDVEDDLKISWSGK